MDGSGRVTRHNRKYIRLYTPYIARSPLIYSPSVIPIVTTGPPVPTQPDAPTPLSPPQPGLDGPRDGPSSTTTGPTTPMPTTPTVSDTDPELLPNDHAITEPSPGPDVQRLVGPGPDVQRLVGHTSPRPRRARRPPRRLVGRCRILRDNTIFVSPRARGLGGILNSGVFTPTGLSAN